MCLSLRVSPSHLRTSIAAAALERYGTSIAQSEMRADAPNFRSTLRIQAKES